MHSGSLEWIRKTGLSARAGLAPGDAFGAIALPFLNQPPTDRARRRRARVHAVLYKLIRAGANASTGVHTVQYIAVVAREIGVGLGTAHASRYLEIATSKSVVRTRVFRRAAEGVTCAVARLAPPPPPAA